MNAGGWFPVGRLDVERILDHAGEKNGPSLIAVWCALLSLANAGGGCELTIPVNAIARAAGLSYANAYGPPLSERDWLAHNRRALRHRPAQPRAVKIHFESKRVTLCQNSTTLGSKLHKGCGVKPPLDNRE